MADAAYIVNYLANKDGFTPSNETTMEFQLKEMDRTPLTDMIRATRGRVACSHGLL